MCEEYSIFGGNCDDVLIPEDAQCPHGNWYDDCSLCNPVPLDDEYDDTPIICHHRNLLADCRECDKEMDEQGGIEKCLNCGRIKYGNQLDKDQVCITSCRNPNEY